MRGRLLAIVIALVVLAFADMGHDDRARTAEREGTFASCQIEEPPAPEREGPAIITAALNTSVTVRTVLIVESNRLATPTLGVSAVNPHLPLRSHTVAKPRVFPLLI